MAQPLVARVRPGDSKHCFVFFSDAVSFNNYLDGRPPGSPHGTFMLMR